MELLTYHRAKQKHEHICPACKSIWRKAKRKCYFCESTFTEERGIISDGSDGVSLKDWVNRGRKLSDEENAERFKGIVDTIERLREEQPDIPRTEVNVAGDLEKIAKQGGTVLDKPLSLEEAKALRIKLREKMDNG